MDATVSGLTSHSCQLPSGPLHYVRAGAGAPLVLIHGSLCDYRYWRWQVASLAQHFTVIAPSLRGCWPEVGTHPQAGYDVRVHADDIQQLLLQLDLGAAHIVGHSRGAEVAWAMVRRSPEWCLSLSLADPGFRFADEPETPPFYAAAVSQLQQGHTEAALAQFVDTVNGEHTWRKMVGWFKQMALDNAATLISQIQEFRLAVSATEIAEQTLPTLLIGGARSPAKYGQRIARLKQYLPQATQVRIALSAHGMNLANPRAFNRAVSEFCTAVHAGADRPAAMSSVDH